MFFCVSFPIIFPFAQMPIQPDLPTDVLVHELPEGWRFVLPRRRLGRLRWTGFVLLAFGLVLTIFNAVLTAGFGLGFGVLGTLLLIPYWGVTLGLMVLGLPLIAGRSEIELRATQLRTIERCGFLQWSWKGPVESVIQIKVVTLPVSAGPLSQIGMALVDFGDERSLVLALGYHEDLLRPLAHDLANRVRSLGGYVDAVGMRDATKVTVRTVSRQPFAARFTLERHDNGVTITVPRPGFRGRAKWALLPGLVWCLMIGSFTGIAVSTAGDAPWVTQMMIIAIICFHWLLAICFLVLALDIAFSRAGVAVLDDQLMILQKGLFGSTRRKYYRDDIASIGVGLCDGQRGNPVLELQIHLSNGRAFGLGHGHSEEELHWIATLLRTALNLSAPQSEV